MYCLFVESGCEPGLMAIFKNGHCLHSLSMSSKGPSFPFQGFDTLLKDVSLRQEDLDALAVGVGPGSFTGIRTGVSVMQAISFSKKIPLISVPTPLRSIPEHDGVFLVAYDARMGGAFCLLAEVRQGELQDTLVLDKLSLEQLLLFREKHDATLVVDSKLGARLAPEQTRILAIDSFQHVGAFISRAWKEKKYDIGTSPQILYLRKTQAEGEGER